jgi:lactoylglutathione lyase
MEIAFLGEGGTQIELIYDEKKKDFDFGADVSWGFKVDSVDRLITSLRAKGIDVLSGPFQPNPHTRFFHVLDPNGMRIQFVEML